MAPPKKRRNQQLLEEFLEDLLPWIDRKQDFDVIIEVLRSMQKTDSLPVRDDMPAQFRKIDDACRFEIFKMQPEGIVWIGYIEGFENAREILSSLNAVKSGVCFLYDNRTGHVVEFLDSSSERGIPDVRDSLRDFQSANPNLLPS